MAATAGVPEQAERPVPEPGKLARPANVTYLSSADRSRNIRHWPMPLIHRSRVDNYLAPVRSRSPRDLPAAHRGTHNYGGGRRVGPTGAPPGMSPGIAPPSLGVCTVHPQACAHPLTLLTGCTSILWVAKIILASGLFRPGLSGCDVLARCGLRVCWPADRGGWRWRRLRRRSIACRRA